MGFTVPDHLLFKLVSRNKRIITVSVLVRNQFADFPWWRNGMREISLCACVCVCGVYVCVTKGPIAISLWYTVPYMTRIEPMALRRV
jgi:hypothetical protein